MKFLSLFCLFILALPVVAEASKTEVIELDSIIAVVNDDVITRIELNNRLQLIKQQLGARTQLPDDTVLRKQVLERIIMEKVQLQIAARQVCGNQSFASACKYSGNTAGRSQRVFRIGS